MEPRIPSLQKPSLSWTGKTSKLICVSNQKNHKEKLRRHHPTHPYPLLYSVQFSSAGCLSSGETQRIECLGIWNANIKIALYFPKKTLKYLSLILPLCFSYTKQNPLRKEHTSWYGIYILVLFMFGRHCKL